MLDETTNLGKQLSIASGRFARGTVLLASLLQASDFLCKASLRLSLCVLFLFTAYPVTAQDAVFDRARVVKAAKKYLKEAPITITATKSSRSAGGLHDFFSEGDYWWPDPQNPDGPYIQRDGMSNPNNFVEHRQYLMRLSVQVPALVAAWKLTKDERYSKHAVKHLHAWFIDEKTRMNPNLQFAQAIHGRFTGRGIGIIDTIHLVEVAQAIEVLKDSNALSMNDLGGLIQWFTEYLKWMTTSKNGIDEIQMYLFNYFLGFVRWLSLGTT